MSQSIQDYKAALKEQCSKAHMQMHEKIDVLFAKVYKMLDTAETEYTLYDIHEMIWEELNESCQELSDQLYGVFSTLQNEE